MRVKNILDNFWLISGHFFQIKMKISFETIVDRNEKLLPLHCQIEGRKWRGRHRELPLWPSRKISLGRPQNATPICDNIKH